VAELNAGELLREWQKAVDSLASSAAGLVGRTDLPRQLRELVERERRLQGELVGQLLAPIDAVFDLLAQSGTMLHRQAEALTAAGRALEDAAGIMRAQAQLIEKTVGAVRQPVELAKAAAAVPPRARAARAQAPRVSKPRVPAPAKPAKPRARAAGKSA